MALVMTPIYTQTVGSGGAASVTFNNIPQFYTDLKVVISARDSYTPSPATNGVDSAIYFNGTLGTTNYSQTRLYGNGSGAGTDRGSNNATAGVALISGNGATANTFGTFEVYIPNYSGSNFKSFATEAVGENNNATAWTSLYAGLWRQTAAITSLTLSAQTSYMQYSTFSLYGIIRQGA